MRRPCFLLLALTAAPAAAADWKAQADPPAAKVEWPADLKVEIPAPRSFFDPEVTFADQGGPFVALGRSGREDSRAFYDLRTSKKIGELTGNDQHVDKRALSPDGKLFAAVVHDFGKSPIIVFDTATGKKAAEVPSEHGAELLRFLAPDKLAYQGGFADKSLHVVDPQTGKESATFTISGGHLWVPPAFSPGGKYVAVLEDDNLILRSTADGAEVGRINTRADRTQPGAFFHAEGLAFSPDGSQIAALSTAGPTPTVLVWSVADGKRVAEVTLEKSNRPAFYDGPKLEWVPDGSAWFVNGDAVYDRDSGKVLFRSPDAGPGHGVFRKAVGAGAIVYLDSKERDNRVLRLASLPADKLAAVRASVRGGGTALDALLPKLKDVDPNAAPEAEVALPGVAWGITPDAAPATPAVARRPVPLPFNLQHQGPTIAGLFVSSGEKPVAVIDLGTADRTFGPVHDRRVVVVSLTTGKEMSSLPLPPDCALAAISADGALAVTTDQPDQRRLDVWSLATGKHVAGWKPYPKANDKDRKLKLVAVSGDRVLTINAANQLVGWQTADAKPVYRAALPGLTVATLSPGGKYLVAMQQGMVRFLDAATGATVGDLEPKTNGVFDVGGVNAVAVRPDGGEVAAVFNAPDHSVVLARWDAKGKLLEQVPFAVAFGATALQYAGTDHLLVDRRSLYDVKRKALVWTYTTTGDSRFASRAPDGRLWYTANTGFNGPASLVAAQLPEEEVEAFVKEVVDGPKAILKPGTKVGVKLAFTGSHADATQKTTKEVIQKALKERGLVYAENGGDVTLDVTASQKETGETIDFRRLFPGFLGDPRERLSVKEIELNCTASLSAGDEKLWSPPAQKLQMREHFGILRLPDKDTDLTDYLYKQLWDRVPGWAAGTGLPRYLAKTDTGVVALPGTTLLQATGPLTGKPGQRK